MSKADDYNHAEIISGRLTMAEITELVKFFQAAKGLTVDGKAGPTTQNEIDKLLPAAPVTSALKFLANPLPQLGDGRRAQITSEFHTDNPSRPDHDGCDLFYPFRPGDMPNTTGNGLAAGHGPNGRPKWVVPYGIEALAAADGIVQIAGNTPTGHRVWIDHGNGLRSGYFHLASISVVVGQRVTRGTPLGLVGDNPKDGDARHLHFEVSLVDRYAPMDPAPYLAL